MDVINLSLGEPEITPSRDIVVKAIDGAAAHGVVPVIAAGNDFDALGSGSIDSPGSAPRADPSPRVWRSTNSTSGARIALTESISCGSRIVATERAVAAARLRAGPSGRRSA